MGYLNSQACWNAGDERCHIEGHQDLILHQDLCHDKLSKVLLVLHIGAALSCGQYTRQELRRTFGKWEGHNGRNMVESGVLLVLLG